MRRVLAILATLVVVAIGLSLLLPYFSEYQEARTVIHSVDWTERGINPNTPGFDPEVVVLAGTLRIDPITGFYPQPAVVGEFEIIMRGYDHYHRIEWRNGRAWWWRTEVAVKGNRIEHSARKTGSGATRGGSRGEEADQKLAVARRLWSGTNFVGAVEGTLIAENHQAPAIEEFRDLERRGRFQIPRTIVCSNVDDGRLKTYAVKKIEFHKHPGEPWFDKQREQRWPDKRNKFDSAEADMPDRESLP